MVEPIDINDDRVQTLLGLGTDATPQQIARLLEKHNGQMDNVATALIEGNFHVDDSELRGRQLTNQLTKPALPPRRKQNSPADNSRALIRVEDVDNPNRPPAYDEDVELNKALELSMAEAGAAAGIAMDDQPPPLEPIQDQPFYGPVKPRGLDESTDHALRQALEASLNDGKNSLAADVYEELPIEQQVRALDGRPTAFRSSDPTSIFVPPVLQSLISVPQLVSRLKALRERPQASQDIEVEQMLDGPWYDTEIIREIFTHAEVSPRAYVDVKEWAEKAGWAREDVAGSFDVAGTELLKRLARALNLSLSSEKPLFLPTLHNPSSPSPPPPDPASPHTEITQQHQYHQLYLVPLHISPSSSDLIDTMESQISADRMGFNLLPEALAVDGPVEIEVTLKGMEEERLKIVRHEGRDTLADLRVCIKHFEHTADPKRAERNARTLEKLKILLKDFEDRCAEIAKKSEELKLEQQNLWNKPELMNLPYDLRAVLIHDGLLGRSHLFSYVKKADKWWKVVDANVTEVTEEVVLGDSVGVHLGAGVLGLVYAAPHEESEHEARWGWKERLKSHKLDKPWVAQLSPETQARLAERVEPVSSDEEEEYMDAEEMIVVDEVQELDVPEDVSMEEVNPPAGVV
ncbi:ubiquitin carboxyl-terminal hydrolase [Ceratobasidium sp. AG-Ba]|nr:ubiquitin carboxyl-terminal hydrolase [Ceratobasidium sp. AG-Ba]